MFHHFLRKFIGGSLKTHISVKMQNQADDGPTLFKMIHEHECGLANQQAIRTAKDAIRSMSLASYNNNVRDMHHAIETQLLVLSSNGAAYND